MQPPWIRNLLPNTHLGPEEAIALLFHVVVDNPGELLLPDLQPVYVDIVLDVLERPPESIHDGSQAFQLGHQLTRLWMYTQGSDTMRFHMVEDITTGNAHILTV